MKEIFYIEDSIKNKISYYHILLFLLALPFDRFYSSIILISFLLHICIHFNKGQLKKISGKTFILQSVFFITLISATYSLNPRGGFDHATKQMAIFLFPLLFSVADLDIKKYRSQLMLGFALGCTLTIIYLFGDAFHVILYHDLPFKVLFSPIFVNHNFSKPVNIHAAYLSMFVVLSILYFLQRLFTYKTFSQQIFSFVCLAILFGGLVMLSSKSACIALMIVLFTGFPFFVLKSRKRIVFLIVVSLATLSVATIILSVDVFRNRFWVQFKKDLFDKQENKRIDWRIARWNTAIDLVRGAPVFGYGSGTELPLLKDVYFERKMYFSYLNELNAHNQYLSFLITSGIMGLFVYISTLFWGLWHSIKARDIFLFGFITLMIIVSLGENLLDVNKGIFFYGFFFAFFMLSKNGSPGRERQATITS